MPIEGAPVTDGDSSDRQAGAIGGS